MAIDFDPIDGLTLRALSDSKAAFASFHFSPSFFDKCSYRTPARRGRKAKRAHYDSHDTETTSTQTLWTGCIPVRALNGVVHQRKGVVSLHLTSREDSVLFRFELRTQTGSSFQVSYRVRIAGTQSTTVIASSRKASEIIVQPTVFLKMIEPLQRTTEMALLINDTSRYISSLSFGGNHDKRRSVAEIEASALKTQVSVPYDQLVEVAYESHQSATEAVAPKDLKERVILVFGMKEFKAIVTFCLHALEHEELPLAVQFHWGGKPVLLSAKHKAFEARLTVATLDHSLIQGVS